MSTNAILRLLAILACAGLALELASANLWPTVVIGIVVSIWLTYRRP